MTLAHKHTNTQIQTHTQTQNTCTQTHTPYRVLEVPVHVGTSRLIILHNVLIEVRAKLLYQIRSNQHLLLTDMYPLPSTLRATCFHLKIPFTDQKCVAALCSISIKHTKTLAGVSSFFNVLRNTEWYMERWGRRNEQQNVISGYLRWARHNLFSWGGSSNSTNTRIGGIASDLEAARLDIYVSVCVCVCTCMCVCVWE